MLIVYKFDNGDIAILEESQEEEFKKKIGVNQEYTKKIYNYPILIQSDMEIKKF